MKLVILSDTHGYHDHVKVPPGDVLIHCGDCTNDIGQASLREFLTWYERQPHVSKLLVAGNHDGAFQKWPEQARAMVKKLAPSVTYLEEESCTIGTTTFFGSPWSPSFCNWYFNADRGEQIRKHWDKIPDNTDVLITHGPPFGILDVSGFDNKHVGCRDLYEAIQRVRPLVHCFGHVHHGYGTHKYIHDDGWDTQMINASVCNEAYKPVNAPWVYEIAT